MKKDKLDIASCIKEVVVVPHKGVVYYDDVNCMIRKFHCDGVRNIYSVLLEYVFTSTGCVKAIRMDYGRYDLAVARYNLEKMSEDPKGIETRAMYMLVTTLDGTRPLNEEIMQECH